MAETQLDRFPVGELKNRYNLVKSAVYTRLKQLKIEPEREGKSSYVDADQLALLDRFDSHIKEGGSIADFPESSGLIEQSSGQAGQMIEAQSSGLIEQSSGQAGQMIMLLLEQMSKRLEPSANSNPIANFEALQKACDHGWLLSTSQLVPLVGLSGKSLNSKREFQRFGFTFTKAGKNGAETAWKISKH